MAKKSANIKSLQRLEELARQGIITTPNSSLEKVVANFSFKISQQMQALIDSTDANDPIVRQFIPTEAELNLSANERTDPIGDNAFTPIKGIIHRYPDRCLFTPVYVCPVYCRFCFRKAKVGPSSDTLTPDEREAAYEYIRLHKEIWEVILTGGDPLILKPSMLKEIMAKLCSMPHVEVIRIHTRVPVVEPERINTDLCVALKCEKPVYIVLHANHVKEFSPKAFQACATLVDFGFPMLSQTTLLKKVNDNIEALSSLMRCFIKNRIKPYYLHHADLVPGTEHFRTTIAEGQALVKELHGHFSGLCQPIYVLDIPGGFGKMPIGPTYLRAAEQGYCVEDYQGNVHLYPPASG